MSAVSLCSWVYCWRDVLDGKPGILSLRQVTLIMDRHKLDEIFGRHGPGYVYELSPQAIALVKRNYSIFVYSEMAADILCFIGVYRFFTGDMSQAIVPMFTLVASMYQLVALWYSLRLVRQWWHQIEEEMDNPE
ncbi:MAG: hypothetical protein AB7L92_09280 [Alphaproteobacteria bacterium]